MGATRITFSVFVTNHKTFIIIGIIHSKRIKKGSKVIKRNWKNFFLKLVYFKITSETALWSFSFYLTSRQVFYVNR